MNTFLQPKLSKIGSMTVMFKMEVEEAENLTKKLVIHKHQYLYNENKHIFPIISIKNKQLSMIDIFHIDIFLTIQTT